MATKFNGTGHSTVVRMQLCVNGHIMSIGQLGPDFLILDNPTDHPACDGEVLMSIDGRERRWQVNLPNGINSAEAETAITTAVRLNGSTAASILSA